MIGIGKTLFLSLTLLQVLADDTISKEVEIACEKLGKNPIGCSLVTPCQGTKLDVDQKANYCSAESIWNDVCSDVGEDSTLCETFRTKCIGQASSDSSCKSGIPNLPKVEEIRKLIKETCTEMPGMKSCKDCGDGSCETPFTASYIKLCASMPGMHECKIWGELCSTVKKNRVISTLWKCPQEEEDEIVPPMKMYLHFSKIEYFWFTWWVPKTNFEFFLSCLFVFIFGVFSSMLKIYRAIKEDEWAKTPTITTNEEASLLNRSFFKSVFRRPPSLLLNAKRAGLVGLVTLVDFLLMLIVMTYNVIIIIITVFGLTLGHFMFVHFIPKPTVPSSGATCCCSGE